MPVIDGAIELHAGVAADMSRFCDTPHQLTRSVGVNYLPGGHGTGLEFTILKNGMHEPLANSNAVIGVLEVDRGIHLTVERTVITCINQGPGFSFLFLFALDELQ